MSAPRDALARMDQAAARHAGTRRPGDHDQPLTSPPVGRATTPDQGPAAAARPPSYRQTSVHLTDDLYRWARDTAIDATRAGVVKVTTSEVIRLAMRRLRDDLRTSPPALDLAAELAEQAHTELHAYPGRAARRLPEQGGQ